GELAQIEGFDEDTASELQTRAREYIEKKNAELDEERKKLGVKDDLLEAEGINLKMAVALGKGGVRSLEDFAGLTPDELTGWSEGSEEHRKRQAGMLDGFGLEDAPATELIMNARVKLGWIEPPPPPEEVNEEEAAAAPETAESVFGPRA